MSVKPAAKRATTVTTHSAPPGSGFGPARVSNLPSAQKELHPLPPVHLDAQDVTPEGLQKRLLDLYESVRVATQPMRQNPESAAAYERRVAFTNRSNAAANVTVTFRHSLGQAPTNGVTPYHSEVAAFSGYTMTDPNTGAIVNPNGEDPDHYVTVTTSVPAGMTAYHSFKLSAQ